MQNLVNEIEEEESIQVKLEQCQKELALYKKLYFELLEAMKEKIE